MEEAKAAVAASKKNKRKFELPSGKILLSDDLDKKLQDFEKKINIENTMFDINFLVMPSLSTDINGIIKLMKLFLEYIKSNFEKKYKLKIEIKQKKTIKLFPATTLYLYIDPVRETRSSVEPGLFEKFYSFVAVKDKPIISIDIYNPRFLEQPEKFKILKTLTVNYFVSRQDLYLPILTKEGFKIFNLFVYNSTLLGTYPINKSRDKKIMEFFTEEEAYKTIEICNKLFPEKSGYIFHQFLEHFNIEAYNNLKPEFNSFVLESLRKYLNTFISVLGDKIKEYGRILKVGGEAIRHYFPESTFLINDMDVNIILKNSTLQNRKNLFIKNLICLYTIVKWINDNKIIGTIKKTLPIKFDTKDFVIEISSEPNNLSIKCEGYDSLYLTFALNVKISGPDGSYSYAINIKPFDMHISTTNEPDILDRYPESPFKIYTLKQDEFETDLKKSVSALEKSGDNFDDWLRTHRRLAKGKLQQDIYRLDLLLGTMTLKEFETIYKVGTVVEHSDLDKVIKFTTDIEKIFEFLWAYNPRFTFTDILKYNLDEFLSFNSKNKSNICDLYKKLRSTSELYKNDSNFFINMINLITSLHELKNNYKTIFIKTISDEDKEINIPETDYSTEFSLFSSDLVYLKWYTTDTEQHKLLNAKLYRQEALTFVEEIVCYELFRILKKCTIKKNTIVYRGIHSTYFMMKDRDARGPETQNFFLSTSVTKFVAEKFGKVNEIKVIKPVNGIYFTNLFKQLSLLDVEEDECLFPPGIQIQKNGDNYEIIGYENPNIEEISISCNTAFFQYLEYGEDVKPKTILQQIGAFFTGFFTKSKDISSDKVVQQVSTYMDDEDDQDYDDEVMGETSSSSSSSSAMAAMAAPADEKIKEILKLIIQNYETLVDNDGYIKFMKDLTGDIKIIINEFKNLSPYLLQDAKDTLFSILLKLSKDREKEEVYYGKYLNFGLPRYENVFKDCMTEYINLCSPNFDIQTELNETCTLLKDSFIEKPGSTKIRQLLNKFISVMNNHLMDKNIGELPKKGGETLRYITEVEDGGDAHTNDIDSELWFYKLEERNDTLKIIFPYVAGSVYRLAELIKKYNFKVKKEIILPDTDNCKIEISSFKDKKEDKKEDDDDYEMEEKEYDKEYKKNELQFDNLKKIFKELKNYGFTFLDKEEFIMRLKHKYKTEYKDKHIKPYFETTTKFILDELDDYIQGYTEKYPIYTKSQLFSNVKTLFLQSLKDTVPYHISVRTNYVGAGCKKEDKTPIQKKKDKDCVLVISIDINFRITLKIPGKEDIYFYKKTSPYDFVFSKRGCLKGIEYDFRQQDVYTENSNRKKKELKGNSDLDDKFLDPCSKYIRQRGIFLPPLMSTTQEFLNIIKLLQDYDRIETNKHKKDLKRTRALLLKLKQKYKDENKEEEEEKKQYEIAKLTVLIESIDYKKGLPTIYKGLKPVDEDGKAIIDYFTDLLKKPNLNIEITREKEKKLDMLPCDNQLCGEIPLHIFNIWQNYPEKKNSGDTHSLGIGEYLSRILDQNPPKAIFAYV